MENLGKYIRDLKAPIFKLRNSQKTRTAYALENTALNQIKVEKKKNACFSPGFFNHEGKYAKHLLLMLGLLRLFLGWPSVQTPFLKKAKPSSQPLPRT